MASFQQSEPTPIPPLAHANAHPSLSWQAASSASSSNQNTPPGAPTIAFNADDEEDQQHYRVGGYHPVAVGDEFANGRYLVVRKLGWGHFSTVWLARDRTAHRHVALKVVKSGVQYAEAAKDEIELLQSLLTADPSHPGRRHTIELLDHFRHHGPNGTHVCMVFEVLGENLLGLIRRYQHRGVPAHIVQQIAKQVLLGLNYMHRKCQIIHTDIKPENVLICIDDVEAVVQAEIDTSPAAVPTRLVGVPPSDGRGGHQTPRQNSILITGSQPLSSPSASLASSPSHFDKWGFGMSRIAGTTNASISASLDDQLTRDLNRMNTGGDALAPGSWNDNPDVNYTPTRSLSAGSGMSTDDPLAARDHPSYQPAPAAGDPNILPPPPPYDPRSLDRITVKIADFGNACWVNKHFTDDIQTRQYRSPEVIIGAEWDTSADMWSAACLFFELITGDFLYDPSAGQRFSKDDDHLAQIIELVGPIPKDFALSGRYSHHYFDRRGDLLKIRHLKYWGLIQVLQDKYLIPFQESNELASFLLPMMRYHRHKRATAQESLQHEWLHGVTVQGEIESRLRIARNSVDRRGSEAVRADALKPTDYTSPRSSLATLPHLLPMASVLGLPAHSAAADFSISPTTVHAVPTSVPAVASPSSSHPHGSPTPTGGSVGQSSSHQPAPPQS